MSSLPVELCLVAQTYILLAGRPGLCIQYIHLVIGLGHKYGTKVPPTACVGALTQYACIIIPRPTIPYRGGGVASVAKSKTATTSEGPRKDNETWYIHTRRVIRRAWPRASSVKPGGSPNTTDVC